MSQTEETGRRIIRAAAKEIVTAIPPWGVRMVAAGPDALVDLVTRDARHMWESVGLMQGLDRVVAAEALAMRFARLAPSPVHQANAFGLFTDAIKSLDPDREYAANLKRARPRDIWRAIVAGMGERHWWRRASLEAVSAIKSEVTA